MSVHIDLALFIIYIYIYDVHYILFRKDILYIITHLV